MDEDELASAEDAAGAEPMAGINRGDLKIAVDDGLVLVRRSALEAIAGGGADASTPSLYLAHGGAIDARCRELLRRAAGRAEARAG